MATYRLTGNDDVVEEDQGRGPEPIAKFKDPKDALKFLRLKEGAYVEITDNWLASEAFYQRFKAFLTSKPMWASKMLSRLNLLDR